MHCPQLLGHSVRSALASCFCPFNAKILRCGQNSLTGDQIIPGCAFASLGFCLPFNCPAPVFGPIHQQHMYHSPLHCGRQLENMLLSSTPLISPTDAKSFLVKQSIVNCTTNQGFGLEIFLMFGTFSVLPLNILPCHFGTTLKTAHQRTAEGPTPKPRPS